MKWLTGLLMLLSLGGCVQAPHLSSSANASIRGNVAIVELNGEPLAGQYRLEVAAGSNRILVRYETLVENWQCLFEWQAQPGQHYELVFERGQDFLLLYTWKRENALWASRRDPVSPLVCERVAD